MLLLSKPDDLNLIPSTQVKKKKKKSTMGAHTYKPTAGEADVGGAWESLTIQNPHAYAHTNMVTH